MNSIKTTCRQDINSRGILTYTPTGGGGIPGLPATRLLASTRLGGVLLLICCCWVGVLLWGLLGIGAGPGPSPNTLSTSSLTLESENMLSSLCRASLKLGRSLGSHIQDLLIIWGSPPAGPSCIPSPAGGTPLSCQYLRQNINTMWELPSHDTRDSTCYQPYIKQVN